MGKYGVSTIELYMYSPNFYRFIKVDSSITQSTNDDESQSSLKVALALNTSDELFSDVRNQNVEKFGSFLQDQVKALKEHHVKFTTKKV